MNISWDVFSSKADLLHLMEFFNFSLVEKESNYLIYKLDKKYLCVININNSYVFLSPSEPDFKGGCIDLLLIYISNIETEEKLSEWGKVQFFINKYIEEIGGSQFLENIKSSLRLDPVDNDFNIFNEKYLKSNYLQSQNLVSTPEDIDMMLSNDITENPLFKGKVLKHKNTILYPLVNKKNNYVGMLIDTDKQIKSVPYSNQKNSIWYSNILPKTKIDTILVFDNPKEAVSFYLNFKIENAIYISSSNFNYSTTKLLFDIQKASKAKKLILTFTGNAKGYVQDLLLFSQMKNMSLILETKSRNIELSFSYDDEKKLSQFYSTIQKYNIQINKEYAQFDPLINQSRIKQNSIHILKDSTDEDKIKVVLPLSLNTLKIFVWSYHKYFVKSKFEGQIEILKPEKNTWHQQYLKTLEIENKNQEMKMYKLAM